jgi:hypothetical protein
MNDPHGLDFLWDVRVGLVAGMRPQSRRPTYVDARTYSTWKRTSSPFVPAEDANCCGRESEPLLRAPFSMPLSGGFVAGHLLVVGSNIKSENKLVSLEA